MKTLIVEDELISRLLLQVILRNHGSVHAAENGKEAVEAFLAAFESDAPFDLICMDIMMPEMDGQQAVKAIRAHEEACGMHFPDGVKIVMTTALGDIKGVMRSYGNLCDAYLVKPIGVPVVADELRKLKLIS